MHQHHRGIQCWKQLTALGLDGYGAGCYNYSVRASIGQRDFSSIQYEGWGTIWTDLCHGAGSPEEQGSEGADEEIVY